MSKTPERSLRYVIRCAGCHHEITIEPAKLDDQMAVCPKCNEVNPTPIYALLSGRQSRSD